MRVHAASVESVNLGEGRHRAAWGSITERTVIHLTMTDELGERAVGEAAPLAGYTEDSLEKTRESLERVLSSDGGLLGASVERPEDIVRLLAKLDLTPAAAHAIDQALLSLLARRAKRSISSLLAPNPRSAIASHALIHDLDGARRAIARGVTALKIKLGLRAWNEELQWVETLRRELGPEVAIRVDVNGAWTLDQATRAWPDLHRLGVDLVEDPIEIGDLGGARALRELIGPRVALDQGCTNDEQLQERIAARAADVVVLKPMVIGGLQRARDLALTAAEAGLSVMVTTCLESELGRQAALAVARAVPAGALEVCGLDPIASVWPGAESLRGPLPNPVASSGIAEPGRTALVTAACSRSWQELARSAAEVAGALSTRGVRPGDVVALEGRPSARWVETFFGITWLGAIAAPVASAHDATILRDLDATYVVSDTPDDVPKGPWSSLHLGLDLHQAEALAEADWYLERPLVRLLTSGTTGQPSVVTLSTAQMLFGALGSTIRLGHHGEDRWLCCLPLHHIGGLAILCRAALCQTSVELHESFDVRRVERSLASGSIQLVSLVPEMLRRLLEANGTPSWPGLRVALIGGASCDPELQRQATKAGVPLSITWGMTETAAQVATTAPRADASLGLPPLPFSRVMASEDGRLHIAGAQAGGPPLSSGDSGRLKDDRVIIDGRTDGVITSGALRIDPQAVRQALLAQSAIQDAHVVSRPHERWGARPVAALVPVDEPIGEQPLRASLLNLLDKPSIPDAWVWVSELPRGPMGKVSGARILEMIEQAQAGEPLTHLVGDRNRLEALHVDEHVDLSRGGPGDSVLGADQLEGEGQAASADGLDLHRDAQPLAQAHGALEVSVGVDQGHAPPEIVKDGRPGRIDGQEQLLESHMSVLKDPTVEGNASPIDLMEPNADLVSESHKADSARQSETPGVDDASSLEGTR